MTPIMWLKRILNRLLPKASFVRNAGVLVGGTAIAQVIGVLSLPLITRLYSPEDFSVLAVYVAILGILSSVACLRLEIAIPLPQRDAVAASLLAIALLCSATIASIVGVLIYFFPKLIFDAAGESELRQFLWMIPLGVWLAGSYSAIQYWATRKKKFEKIAGTRIVQAASSNVVQLVGGVLNSGGALCLLLGQIVTGCAGIIGLGRMAWSEDRVVLSKITRNEMWCSFKEYIRFPKYSVLESLTNNAAVQIPVIIIASGLVGSEAGFLFLAMKAMAIPMGLIGGAVSQVYLSSSAEEYNKGQIIKLTLNTISGLIRTGVGPLIFAGIIAPVAFPIFFGDEWRRAGEMVAWMTPWFILQFVTSPISMSLHVTNNQSKALLLQCFGLILRVGGTFLSLALMADYVFEVYALTGVVFYATYFAIVAKALNLKALSCVAVLISSFYHLLIWVMLGILFYFIFNNLL